MVSATDTSSGTLYSNAAPKWIGGVAPTVISGATNMQSFTTLGIYSPYIVMSSVVSYL